MRRLGPVTLLTAVLAALALLAPPAAAFQRAPTAGVRVAETSVAPAVQRRVSCATASDTPVVDGTPLVVRMPPAAPFVVGQIPAQAWREPPVADPSWQLHFRGLMWMLPLAQRAYGDGAVASLDAMVAQAVAAHAANPDPGTPTRGWDEGTALRRLEVLTCLYRLTRDQRLVPLMHADANVLLGPRYYGPPHRPVHNHGLMANVRLVRAANLLNVPSWKSVALQRMRAEAPLAFSRSGTSWEQSSLYQGIATRMWEQAANILETEGGADTTVRAIRATTARANAVSSWLTEPDGHLVQIGNSDRALGAPPLRTTQRVFRDNEAGLVVGRWSWTDPDTDYYTLRYGPPRRAHGHEDRPGVTWSTAGVRVLVGPGRFDYDVRSKWNAYQVGPAGQNVAVPVGRLPAPRGSVQLAAYVVQARAHGWRFRDSLYGRTHERGVNVNTLTRTLKVTDTYTRGTRFTQTWHLDPGWTLTRRTPQQLTFTHEEGRTLTVRTTGQVSAVVRGQTRTVAGWNFPAFGSRVPAPQITVVATTTAETSFTVR